MKSMVRFRPVEWLIAATTLAMVAKLQAANPVNVVSPASFKDKEGEEETRAPATANFRFQQFYHSANFIGSLPNGGYIREISFRTDGSGGGGLAAVLTHVEIHLGYAGAFNQISTEFAKNQGGGYALVYSGSLNIPRLNSGQYDITVALQTPFLYDPNAGNLMLDYVNFGFGGFGVGLVDLSLTAGETGFLSGSRFSSQAIGLIGGGLITRFTIDPVPEPGFAALLALGGAILVMVRRMSEP